MSDVVQTPMAIVESPIHVEAVEMSQGQQRGLWLAVVVTCLALEVNAELNSGAGQSTAPPPRRRQQPVIADERKRLIARIGRAASVIAPHTDVAASNNNFAAASVDDLRNILLALQDDDVVVDRLGDARRLAGFGDDIHPIFDFSVDPDLTRIETRFMTGVRALQLFRARRVALERVDQAAADELYKFATPFGSPTYSSDAAIFLAVSGNTVKSNDDWLKWTPVYETKPVGAHEKLFIGHGIVFLNDGVSMDTVSHATGLSAKETAQADAQAAMGFRASAMSLGEAKDVKKGDLAARHARTLEWCEDSRLCDNARLAADARWYRLRNRFFDQYAQRRVDLAKAIGGRNATTAFLVGDGAFTSNATARQIVDWADVRKIFAKHGYSFVVPEFNTSRIIACCLAPTAHPKRKAIKTEQNRSFKKRIKNAKSEKARNDVSAWGRIRTESVTAAYSCSQCTRCRRTHARDTSSAELISLAGICSLATGRRPAALCFQRESANKAEAATVA